MHPVCPVRPLRVPRAPFTEIGPVPRRDRSYSASRSVTVRTEIGSLPPRDRSGSASRLWCQDIWNSGSWWSPVWWFSGLGVVWVGQHRREPALLMLACTWGGGCSRLRQDAGQSRCPHAPERCGDAAHGLVVAVPVPACARWRIGGRDGRQFSGRCPHAPGVVGCEHLTSTRVNPGVAWAGVVGVAHSRAPRTGGNRGIMRNSTVSSGRSPVPMCAGPPDRTWEPDHHTRRSPEKPTIPTKTSPHPAEVPVSCVQYRGQPHPLGTSGSLTTNPPQIRTGTRPILNAECGMSGHLRQFECLRCSDCGEVVSRLVGGY